MADILIRGMDMPNKDEILVFDVWHGEVYARSTANTGTRHYEVVSLPEGHEDLIERKALNLFPDYKEVRNGIKQTIKAAERDGRNISGVTIDLLKQTLVALDSLHSVRRYFLNAKAIVPAEGVGDDG